MVVAASVRVTALLAWSVTVLLFASVFQPAPAPSLWDSTKPAARRWLMLLQKLPYSCIGFYTLALSAAVT
jgi:hypothetical protein